MKKLAFALALAAMSGCMTSEISRTPNGVEGDGSETHLVTVDIENVGWYLFDIIPILCGDPQHVNEASSVFFRDTLLLQNNIDELMRIAQREGSYTIGSIVSHEERESVWVLIMSRHGYHTSATLMRKHH